jgi:hypothetical protein
MRRLFFSSSLPLLAAAAAALMAPSVAMATLVTPVSVNLIALGGYTQEGTSDATPINLTQNLDYANPITTITPPIGTFLITGERVELIGDAIHIRAGAGDNRAPAPNNLRTGLLGSGGSDKARYVFNGLDIAGANITGFTISTLDTSGPGAGTFSGVVGGTTFLSLVDTDADGSLDRLSFNLEDLRFVPRAGVTSFNQNFADFTISLISTPIVEPPTVPEPSSLLLAFAALAGLGYASRAKAAGPAGKG